MISITNDDFLKLCHTVINMNFSEYKTYHESFMKNNHGSNAVHTYFCIFFTVQCTLLCSIREKKSLVLQCLIEYIIIVLPLILVHTLFAEYIYHLNLLVSIILLYNVVHIKTYIKVDQFCKFENGHYKRLHSITCVRGLTYLITGFAILAVDFKDFPRYLAKTETYGYSLMDTGVGLFVLMSGLVHRDLQNNLSKVMNGNIKFIIILLVLGISRYLSIKQLEYHEHVTEYGVHWNFFFTLAFCKVMSTVLLLISSKASLLSILTIVVHEFLLYCGFEQWVFGRSPRSNLIDANREGISSNLGYVSLYLLAVNLKKILTNRNIHTIQTLIKYTILSVLIAFIVNLFKPTSRTLANAGYCTFLISVLLIVITIMYFFEMSLSNNSTFRFEPPIIVSSINNNGLIYFIICNLFTGFINMTFQTLLLSTNVTFLILNFYMIFTLFTTMIFDRKGIKI